MGRDRLTVGDLDPGRTVRHVANHNVVHLDEYCEHIAGGETAGKEARVLHDDTPVCKQCSGRYSKRGAREAITPVPKTELLEADPGDWP